MPAHEMYDYLDEAVADYSMLKGDTIAFHDNSPDPDTITDSNNGFLNAGFEAGQSLVVSGSTSNDGTYTIAGVTAGTITLAAEDQLTDESAGAEVLLDMPDVKLSISPKGVLPEEGDKDQEINKGDDGSEVRLDFGNKPELYTTVYWKRLREPDSGTVFDWFNDPVKANYKERSFKWPHPTDGHLYVARFDSGIRRSITLGGTLHLFDNVRLRILGKRPDA